jgi:hypothetical protein
MAPFFCNGDNLLLAKNEVAHLHPHKRNRPLGGHRIDLICRGAAG